MAPANAQSASQVPEVHQPELEQASEAEVTNLTSVTPEQRKIIELMLSFYTGGLGDVSRYSYEQYADALRAVLASQREHQAGDCFAPPCEICEGYYPFPPHIEAER
jgi:hypothetical protein